MSTSPITLTLNVDMSPLIPAITQTIGKTKVWWFNLRRAFGLPAPNRKSRKRAKLEARGTYRRADQWALDLSRKRVIASAASLAPHLNITTADLLARVGFE